MKNKLKEEVLMEEFLNRRQSRRRRRNEIKNRNPFCSCFFNLHSLFMWISRFRFSQKVCIKNFAQKLFMKSVWSTQKCEQSQRLAKYDTPGRPIVKWSHSQLGNGVRWNEESPFSLSDARRCLHYGGHRPRMPPQWNVSWRNSALK